MESIWQKNIEAFSARQLPSTQPKPPTIGTNRGTLKRSLKKNPFQKRFVTKNNRIQKKKFASTYNLSFNKQKSFKSKSKNLSKKNKVRVKRRSFVLGSKIQKKDQSIKKNGLRVVARTSRLFRSESQKIADSDSKEEQGKKRPLMDTFKKQLEKHMKKFRAIKKSSKKNKCFKKFTVRVKDEKCQIKKTFAFRNAVCRPR